MDWCSDQCIYNQHFYFHCNSKAMSIGGYKIRNQQAIHFITFAVVGWIDVFTRKTYCDIVVERLKYCQDYKGMQLHCWCLMSNHLHFRASATNNDLSDILRDFKKFTSQTIINVIINNEKESRKEWMLGILRKHGVTNSRNSQYQFWRQDNHPVECYSPEFTVSKMDYIHNNPVVAGIVDKPQDYVYSSARSYGSGDELELLKVQML